MAHTRDERLARIERMLLEVLERLKVLEETLRGEESLSLAGEIVGAFNLPAYRALEASRAIIELTRRIGRMDDVMRSIVEALAVRGPMTVRGLEREVRRIRGRASRRIIAERLRVLEEMGLVEVERGPSRSIVRLKRVEEGGSRG